LDQSYKYSNIFVIFHTQALKRASRKKELELDIEDKKLNMTLDTARGRDGDQFRDDPYYDNLD